MTQRDKLQDVLATLKVDRQKQPTPPVTLPLAIGRITAIKNFSYGFAASFLLCLSIWFFAVDASRSTSIQLASVHTTIEDGLGSLTLVLHSNKAVKLADFQLSVPDTIAIEGQVFQTELVWWIGSLERGLNSIELPIYILASIQQGDSQLQISVGEKQNFIFDFEI